MTAPNPAWVEAAVGKCALVVHLDGWGTCTTHNHGWGPSLHQSGLCPVGEDAKRLITAVEPLIREQIAERLSALEQVDRAKWKTTGDTYYEGSSDAYEHAERLVRGGGDTT